MAQQLASGNELGHDAIRRVLFQCLVQSNYVRVADFFQEQGFAQDIFLDVFIFDLTRIYDLHRNLGDRFGIYYYQAERKNNKILNNKTARLR